VTGHDNGGMKMNVINFGLSRSGLLQIKAKQAQANLKNNCSNDGEKY